jgi:hypothetical protein
MICYFTLIRNYSWWFQQWRVFLSFPLQELLCIVARGSLFKRIMFLLRKFCSASLTFLYRVVISSVLHWIVMVLVHSQDGSPTVNFLCSRNGELSEMLYIFMFLSDNWCFFSFFVPAETSSYGFSVVVSVLQLDED